MSKGARERARARLAQWQGVEVDEECWLPLLRDLLAEADQIAASKDDYWTLHERGTEKLCAVEAQLAAARAEAEEARAIYHATVAAANAELIEAHSVITALRSRLERADKLADAAEPFCDERVQRLARAIPGMPIFEQICAAMRAYRGGA